MDDGASHRPTDKPSRHFSSASDPTAMTRGARREKRRGLHHVAAGESSQPRLRHRRNAPENATSGTWKSQPLLVLSARTSSSPPQEGGAGLRTGRRRAARFPHTASASLRREGNSTEVTSIEREDHPLPGVPVCRLDTSRSTVAEVVGPCAAQVVFALSRGERRRSLAFHFDVSSGSHRKGTG